MAVPKSGGCCGASRKPAPKKPAPKASTKSSATKKPTTKSTSSKTTSTSSSRNSDEALKKRLKKILGKDNDTKGTSTKGNSDHKETNFPNDSIFLNEFQKFILNSAKTEKKATPFSKIDKNVKKTTTKTKANTSAVKKPSNNSTKTVAKKPSQTASTKKPTQTASTKKTTSSTTAKKTTSASTKTAAAAKKTTTAKKPASASTKTKSAPAVKKYSTTAAKKASSATSNKKTPATTKKKTTANTTAASKKRSTAAPKRTVPAKKTKTSTTKRTTNNRMSCGGGGCGPRKMDCGGCGCGCGDDSSTSSSYDSSDDESESESTTDYTSDDSSYTSDETDTDSSSGGCGGGACGRPQQSGNNGPSKGGDKDQDDDSSGSWETEESDDDNTNYSKKACNDWQCESVSSPIDTSNGCNDSSWMSEEVIASSNFSNTDEETEIIKSRTASKKEKSKLKRPHKSETTESEDNQSAKLNGYKDSGDTSSLSEATVPIKKKIKSSETKNTEKKNSKDDKNIEKQNKTADKANNRRKVDEKINNNVTKKFSVSSDLDSTEKFEHGPMDQSLVRYNHVESSASDYSFDEYQNTSTILAGIDEDGFQSSSDLTYEEEEERSDSDDDEFVSDSDADDWYDEEMSEEESEYEEADFDEEETDSSSFESYGSSESEYESSRDDDYKLPEGVEEDILIKRGEAKIYDATDDIHFDSDDSSPQIFELPSEEINLTQSQKVDSTVKQTNVEIKVNDDNASDKSSDSCPQLVPIVHENAYNHGEDDLQYSSTDDDYTTDSSDGNQSEPLIYEPEVINAVKLEKVDISFVDNILQTSLQEDSENNFADPLTCIMQKPSKTVKNTSVSAIKMTVDSKKKQSAVTPTTIEPANITSSLQPTSSKFYNSLSQRRVLLLLKSPIYFHGALKVKLLAGNLNILGYGFTIGETQEVFSPRGNNLLPLLPGVVETSNKTNKSKADIAKKLSGFSKDFMQTEIDQIAKEFDPKCDAIVLLERNNYTKRIYMVQKYIKEEIFPNAIIDRGNGFYKSELFTRCRFFTECFNSFNAHPKWDSINLIDSSKLMVIGGKGVGKSTFLRYTINKNLQKFKQFLLIDLDIGQPETFAPQTISATIINKPLIGPGHYYGLKPVKSYLYGDINVVLSPITYLTNVKELLKYCHGEKRFQSIPWVVNTMGYNKGFGTELLSVIIEYLQPTDIVQLESVKRYNNFDFPMSPQTVRNIPRNIYKDEERFDIFDYNLYEFESVVPSQKLERPNEWMMTAKDSRLTMIIAMLGDLLSERDKWLTDVSPYSVEIDDLNLINIEGDILTKADLLDVVNANLVYLCKDSKPAIECYGIGIVRGVDKIRQILYLLPSVSPQILAQVNTLAICNIPLPTSILLNQGPKIKGMVPYTYNTNDLISSKHVPQSIYRPQHFLQGARNIILDE